MSSAPEQSLRRILVVSAIDGWSVALFAGLCALIALLFGGWVGVVVGGLISAAGVIELRGRAQLVQGNPRGMRGLVGAQLLILGTIWVYSLGNLITYDEARILAAFTPEARSLLSQRGLAVEDLQPMLKPAFFGFYLIVMGVTLLFQGALALYYHARREKVRLALAGRQTPPALPDA